MNKQTALAMSVALLSAASAVAQSSNTSTNTSDALNKEGSKSLEKASSTAMVGVSFDYLNCKSDQTVLFQGDNPFKGELKGDLYGGTVSFSLGNRWTYFDLGYQGGTLDGNLKYLNNESLQADTSIDRKQYDFGVSFKDSGKKDSLNGQWGYRFGIAYSYIDQDITVTLPETWYWTSTGTRVNDYSETFHNFGVELGVQYDWAFYEGDNVRLDLVPRILGGAGVGIFPESDYQSSSAGFSYKLQGTVAFEVHFGKTGELPWRWFAEGGYKKIGLDGMESVYTTSSYDSKRDYKGFYARTGVTYQF